ncbi:MAG: class I SAM-dependent methyltransferase [bacterium]
MSNPSPTPELWNAVDRAFEDWLAPADDALNHATAAATKAGLPEIAVAAAQGRFLQVFTRSIGARRILEVGTLAGYSAIWLARALPAGGRLVTLELDPARAEIARGNLAHAGLSDQVDVIVGPAVSSLDAMIARGEAPFDLIFIDADKENCPRYLERAVELSHPGTLIIVDNVVRRGRVIEPDTGDAGVDGVRAMMAMIARHPRLEAAGLQTVGAKGYDGLLIARVTAAQPPAAPAIARIYETILYGSDLDAAAAFYSDVVGLPVTVRMGDRGVAFRLDAQSVLIVFDPAKTVPQHETVPSHGTTGEGHIAFSVDDLGAWRAHLDRLGVPIEREVDWSLGGKSIYVRDPARNSVEFVQGRVWNL